MNSLRHGALDSASAWLIDLTVTFVIGIPLILIVILVWEATRDD